MVGVVDCPDFPFSGWERPLVVLSDVDVVLLGHFSPKNEVKMGHLAAGFSDGLAVEVEPQLAFVEKSVGLFVLEVQLSEESALQHIVDFISFFVFDVLSEFVDNQRVNSFVKGEDNGLFLAVERVIGLVVEAAGHDNLILLVGDNLFVGL